MEKGVNVIQLETASGAAIQSFEGAQGNDLLEIFFFNEILFLIRY